MPMSIVRKRISSRASVLALLAVAGSIGPCPLSFADTDLTACAGLVGTYVTTFTDREGVFASRGLMTFTSEGLLLVSDSAQGGVPGVWDPFSETQGIWRCLKADAEKLSIGAIGLNFVLPTDGRTPSFGRVDYQARLDGKTGLLSGSATLRLAPDSDLEGANPMERPATIVDKFQLDGKRIVIK